MLGRRNRLLGLMVAGLAALAAAGPAGAAAGFSDADYWAVADRSMAAMDAWWAPAHRVYDSGLPSTRMNANLLTVHAIAALERHRGASRDDARARTLAATLTRRPVWRHGGAIPGADRSVCWAELATGEAGHAALDGQVADALAWAWRARRALELRAAVAARIVRRLGRCARDPRWAVPATVINQVNWNTALFAAAATVTGRGKLLRRDYRRSLAWFADGITRPSPGRRAANLGPGYAFRYRPTEPATAPVNSDTPEYANLVVGALAPYARALAAGMRPLPRRSVRLLRAWVRRLLAGSWTHAGYLNWDTGLGARRWHSAQYWAFAQQGLLTIAAAPRFRTAREGRWAKALLDRALGLHERFADAAGTALAPSVNFGVRSLLEVGWTYAARIPATAARAVALGLGRRRSEDPPPLYAFDPDTGRLAITTPAYSTAIVPDNRGAFDYGGIEPARLFGAGQRVAANVGGTPPASFGVVVRDAAGATVLASQQARARPLRLLRSPRGRLDHPRAYPASPYAGPFRVVQARGDVRAGGARVTAWHRFGPRAVESRWLVRCAPGACHGAAALFPTWGAAATIDVVMRAGGRRRLAGDGAVAGEVPVALADVARIELRGIEAGYDLTPAQRPDGAVLRVLPVAAQPTNPQPGPTLAVDVARPAGLAEVRLAVRLEPRG